MIWHCKAWTAKATFSDSQYGKIIIIIIILLNRWQLLFWRNSNEHTHTHWFMEMSAEWKNPMCQSYANPAMFCQQTASCSERMIAACETVFEPHSAVKRKHITWTNKETLFGHIYQGRKNKSKQGGCVFKSLFLILTRKKYLPSSSTKVYTK